MQQIPSSVTPLHLEGGEEVLEMHKPMQVHEKLHSLQGPLQTDGATKKQYQGQERYVGKVHEEKESYDNDDKSPSQGHHKIRTNEKHTKRSRKHSNCGSSSSSSSFCSSHRRFPRKSTTSPTPPSSSSCTIAYHFG